MVVVEGLGGRRYWVLNAAAPAAARTTAVRMAEITSLVVMFVLVIVESMNVTSIEPLSLLLVVVVVAYYRARNLSTSFVSLSCPTKWRIKGT